MPTRLPKPKDIIIKEVKDFDGSPSGLPLFDTQVYNALKRIDIPVYFCGSVVGNEDDGFRYVPAGTVEAKPNYKLVQQFDPTVDAQQAELELESYRWESPRKKAFGAVPFRGHVNWLCTRAGKTA
ncbi:hypothetical protein L211DRAFT_853890 [Terfezia boudieri ATCC MYA-4762]|uniref:Uncharacterized protein n=1 Tax=Terfezia boudieri ATCC MYA-4762 TaxID=1051890 RepID=A0A3N4L6Z8_9PEZI|nr:hypothetical protein L211DRAFT_853890 [Terfezia boudieri ATCC MYA-4762]